mmetsp:Transcript_20566/g.57334  ORF Transcript_20566/g.57334 Transcript_20566/m.57334 type:complete len:309 (+) Transcript_20566:122-1048(+)
MGQDVLPPDERRARVQELSSMMNSQPSETELIKEVVAMLEDPELSSEDTLQALEALQVLVEPIDNANDMKVLGAISPVVDLLKAEEGTLRAAAAYVVGTAASNNPRFQLDLLEVYPDIFSRLRQLLLDSDDEVCNKGLYAVGSLVRNQRDLSHTFLAGGGLGHLESLMLIPRASQADVRIKRKALSVAMDIFQVDDGLVPLFLGGNFPQALLQLLQVPNLDLQEKALGGLQALLHSRHEPVVQALRANRAEESLMKLQSQLAGDVRAQQAESGDDDSESYLSDVLHLCSSVLGMMAQQSGQSAERTEL